MSLQFNCTHIQWCKLTKYVNSSALSTHLRYVYFLQYFLKFSIILLLTFQRQILYFLTPVQLFDSFSRYWQLPCRFRLLSHTTTSIHHTLLLLALGDVLFLSL